MLNIKLSIYIQLIIKMCLQISCDGHASQVLEDLIVLIISGLEYKYINFDPLNMGV